jgi:iron complex transport system substrate-binding protein
MRPIRTPLRRLAAALATGAVALSLAACGSEDEPATVSAPEADAAFPVTITHKLGATTVEAAPTKVVALSDADLDALLVLGIQPVAVGASIGEEGITPWAKPALTGKPKVLEPGDNGYEVEDILALEPELVLAGGDYYIDSEYKGLTDAGIPTTAYEDGPAEDSWQTVLRQVGKAVGRSADAERIVGEVEAKVAAVKTDNAGIVGKKFSLSQMWEAGSIGTMRSDADTGVKMLNDFGLVLDPKPAALTGEDFAAQLSLEKVATLDSDLVLVYFADAGLQPGLEKNALFAKLPAVQRGAYVPLTVEQFSTLRSPTPLSVPYTIENVVPLLVKAASAG